MSKKTKKGPSRKVQDERAANEKAKRVAEFFRSIRYQHGDRSPGWFERPNPQIEITLSHTQQVAEVIEALSDRQLLDKVSLSIRPSASRPKSSQQPAKTIHTCYVQRLAGNTLQCKVCGQKIPSTREGEIDKEQLAHEMLLRTWNCLHR